MAESFVGLAHPFAPIVDERSRVLVLGTFPSVKSRENTFYYGHPQNRFWKVTAAVFAESVPQTIDEKRAMLLRNGVALWDVLASCDIVGSADSSIRNAVPNDLAALLASAPISRVYCNGQTAFKLFQKHFPTLSAQALPSTSPANAAWTLPKLIEEWRVLLA